MLTKKIRIVSDSSAPHLARSATRVFDGETGEDISGRVTRVCVTLDANDPDPVLATLTLIAPELDIVCDAQIKTEQTLVYDPDDIDSLDRAITLLYTRRSELASR